MAITSTVTKPKFRALCRTLNLPQAWVLGHLELYWQTCHAHGHVMHKDDFEEAAGWVEAFPDRAGELLAACIQHRWLDVDGDNVAAHDYMENAPRFVKNRLQTRERMQARRKQVQTNANDVKQFDNVCKSLQSLTIEKEIDVDVDKEHINTHVCFSPPEKPKRQRKTTATPKYSEAFEAAWKAYPHHGCRSSKHQSYDKWCSMRLESVAGLPELILRWVSWAAKQNDWTKQAGQFVPGFQVWLGKRPWVSGEPPAEEAREFGSPEDC